MAYARTTTVNAAPGGDSVKQAVLDLDADLTSIYDNLNTHETDGLHDSLVADVATVTTINKLTLTAPATSATLTIANGKTLTVNNTVTFAGTDSTTLTLPAETSSLGYLNIPQNSRSSNYTCVLGDAGKHIFHPAADTAARTFTIPANSSVAYPIATALTFINQNGGGVITIAITTDTMRLAGAGTTGSRTLAANGIATAIKVTSTEWLISGAGLT